VERKNDGLTYGASSVVDEIDHSALMSVSFHSLVLYIRPMSDRENTA